MSHYGYKGFIEGGKDQQEKNAQEWRDKHPLSQKCLEHDGCRTYVSEFGVVHSRRRFIRTERGGEYVKFGGMELGSVWFDEFGDIDPEAWEKVMGVVAAEGKCPECGEPLCPHKNCIDACDACTPEEYAALSDKRNEKIIQDREEEIWPPYKFVSFEEFANSPEERARRNDIIYNIKPYSPMPMGFQETLEGLGYVKCDLHKECMTYKSPFGVEHFAKNKEESEG